MHFSMECVCCYGITRNKLYHDAIKNNIPCKRLRGYSFHSYHTLPLPTENLSAAEILKFRDESFIKYHTHEPLERIKKNLEM